ncbi:organomercurial lyase MerB [Flexivirga meconopsidis]|uniref:organomercurial lyase MerB n=1 Tax=Flexivirga meconopsidis TaxID=2977121 RepID=UPI0022407A88|nr:organomercurial lyase MerB [Flexivirga meconopsidis]
MLTAGQPVSAEQLAAATGRSVAQIHAALPNLPSIELDAQARVIGMGITLTPTAHRFEVQGTRLYTWCALDTLIFPALIGRTAHVTSSCHATGEPVRLTVSPDHVFDITPADAVVSIVTPDDVSAVRTSFCNEVHFFASPEAAAPWLAEHPGATVLPITDAFALGQGMAANQFTSQPPACC